MTTFSFSSSDIIKLTTASFVSLEMGTVASVLIIFPSLTRKEVILLELGFGVGILDGVLFKDAFLALFSPAKVGAFQNIALSSKDAFDFLLEAGEIKFLSQSNLESMIT